MNYNEAIKLIAENPKAEMTWGTKSQWYNFKEYFECYHRTPLSVAGHCTDTDFEVRGIGHEVTIDGKTRTISDDSYKALKDIFK